MLDKFNSAFANASIYAKATSDHEMPKAKVKFRS